jgi:trehalose synthase
MLARVREDEGLSGRPPRKESTGTPRPEVHVKEQTLAPVDTGRLRFSLDDEARARFDHKMERARQRLQGRTVWHVNSAARGGGVAELLRSLLPYVQAAGIKVRWLVVDGDQDFFDTTKQLHHLLHDAPGDGTEPGEDAVRSYERTLTSNLAGPAEDVRDGDVVVLHDPQTAGLAPSLLERRCIVVWACHIGADRPGRWSRAAWRFLLPYLRGTQAQIFSRAAYVWEGLDRERVAIIPPCIDVCSPKNAPMDGERAAAVLAAAGIVGNATGEPTFVRADGSVGHVRRRADVIEEEQPPRDAPLVIQVSRWDPLKDMSGVMTGFIERVTGAHLLLVGPAVGSVGDDPESAETFGFIRKQWEQLTCEQRARVHLVCAPMDDLEENAAIVNAVQRRADVVVQKSLAEGFGLTVAEAMWKERPVVGSRVGGIQDQIVDGESGLLVDAEDLAACGDAVHSLLRDRDRAHRLGTAAHARVYEEYLAPKNLERTMGLIERLVG